MRVKAGMSDYRVTLLAEQAGSSRLTAAWTERRLEGRECALILSSRTRISNEGGAARRETRQPSAEWGEAFIKTGHVVDNSSNEPGKWIPPTLYLYGK